MKYLLDGLKLCAVGHEKVRYVPRARYLSHFMSAYETRINIPCEVSTHCSGVTWYFKFIDWQITSSNIWSILYFITLHGAKMLQQFYT